MFFFFSGGVLGCKISFAGQTRLGGRCETTLHTRISDTAVLQGVPSSISVIHAVTSMCEVALLVQLVYNVTRMEFQHL